ncbi:MAG TPA: Crp/Fnr family transcriptional regulator [Mycobacteriales bacterium]|nr:Crp/Fnr family transcriptional regulator [Mycobacteriales bacterium]
MDAALADTGLFRGLSRCQAEELAGRFEQHAVTRREVVFAEGEPGEHLYVVLAGKLKLCRRAPDGRQAVLAVLGPGDLLGELTVVDGGPRSSTAVALTAARVARLPARVLRGWVRTHPPTAEAVLALLARQVRRSTDGLTGVAWSDVPSRLAGHLLDLAVRFGSVEDGRARVTHDLSQEELGHLVGATRETVNKTLGEFSRRGWIRTDGRTLVILDPVRLARRAGLPGAGRSRLPLAG